MRLCDYLDRGAELYPEHVCLDNGQEQWRYEAVLGVEAHPIEVVVR